MEASVSLISCELCHKNFSQKSSRNRHVREQHLQSNLYQCKECRLRFSKKYNLQNHQKHVHLKNQLKNKKQLKCSYCTSIFTKSESLKKHVKIQHERFVNTSPETDAEILAESVLKELKQLQNDLQLTIEPEQIQQQTAIDVATVKDVNIKDNLYPSGHFKFIKVQTIKRVNGLKYLICEFCSKEFRKTYNFLRHRRIHTKIRPFKCILCKKSFATSTQLKTHCNIHKLNETFGVFHYFYKCPQCNEGFSAIKHLDEHLRLSLTCCNVLFKCPECLKSFNQLQKILNHKHLGKDKELEFLKQLLPTPITVKQSQTEDNQNYLHCNLRGFQVKSKILLQQHEKRHTNLYKYQCTECQGSYATAAALKIHTKAHLKVKKFKCHYCNTFFNTAQNCRQHMMRHLKLLIKDHVAKEKSFSLNSYPTFIENQETGQIENTETSIIKANKSSKIHLKQTTAKLKYKCPKCDKSFRFNAWLKKHFKYKHTIECAYECQTCLKKFRTKQSLESHLLIHATERIKLTCQVCARQYASPKSLQLHLRLHTQEMPFKCAKCGKLFRTSGHLIQHQKSNHKE